MKAWDKQTTNSNFDVAEILSFQLTILCRSKNHPKPIRKRCFGMNFHGTAYGIHTLWMYCVRCTYTTHIHTRAHTHFTRAHVNIGFVVQLRKRRILSRCSRANRTIKRMMWPSIARILQIFSADSFSIHCAVSRFTCCYHFNVTIFSSFEFIFSKKNKTLTQLEIMWKAYLL